MPLHLYEHPVSSYAQKIKIALRHKSIPYTSSLPEGLSSASASSSPLAIANPRLEVPVLIDSDESPDLAVFDSTVIMEYLEDKFPERPLLPKSAAGRAKARMVEEVCDTHYEACNWGVGEVRWFGRAGEEGVELRQRLEAKAAEHTKVLQAWLEERLKDEGGKWFGGDEFGYADVCAAPMVNRSVSYGLGPVEGTLLRKWHERLSEVPAVEKTFAEFDEGIKKITAPEVREVYLSGKAKREYRDHRLEWMVKAGGLDIVAEGIKRNNVRFSWPE